MEIGRKLNDNNVGVPVRRRAAKPRFKGANMKRVTAEEDCDDSLIIGTKMNELMSVREDRLKQVGDYRSLMVSLARSMAGPIWSGSLVLCWTTRIRLHLGKILLALVTSILMYIEFQSDGYRSV